MPGLSALDEPPGAPGQRHRLQAQGGAGVDPGGRLSPPGGRGLDPGRPGRGGGPVASEADEKGSTAQAADRPRQCP